MKLREIHEAFGEAENIEIYSLAFDTSQVIDGSLFFCLEGTKTDGHNFAEKALESGAVAIVTQRKLPLDCIQIVVKNTRKTLSECACNFYGNPSKKLKLIGITGTNGKTTTSYIVKSIIEASGERCGIIGTNGWAIETRHKLNMTTPDSIELQEILKEMVDEGVKYAVMEVSAHALALDKLCGVSFYIVAFTNLSQDHLDFFKDMETYKAAKMKLFTREFAQCAVINVDDETGLDILKNTNLPSLTYGCQNPSDVFAVNLEISEFGIEYVLNLMDDIMNIKFSLSGRFNMYNTLCAATIARLLGIKNSDIEKGIFSLKKVDGRFNIINTANCSVLIDFAHTEDGLKNILSSVKEFAKKRIITVFGCGGNRDTGKRSHMGEVAATLSDYCIVTSDNPRFEPPMQIIGEIEEGIKKTGKTNYCLEPDRKAAILKALNMADTDDIIVIAGKGAESYQEVMGKKIPYNDEEFILNTIEGSRK